MEFKYTKVLFSQIEYKLAQDSSQFRPKWEGRFSVSNRVCFDVAAAPQIPSRHKCVMSILCIGVIGHGNLRLKSIQTGRPAGI